MLGDLTEEYALREERGRTSWYWIQVLRSIPPSIWSSAFSGGWFRALGIALTAFFLASLLEYVGNAAFSRWIGSTGLLLWISNLVVGLSTMLAGGLLANWLRQGSAVLLAIMELVVVAALMVLAADSVPLWYQLAYLVLGPSACLAGGRFYSGSHSSLFG